MRRVGLVLVDEGRGEVHRLADVVGRAEQAVRAGLDDLRQRAVVRLLRLGLDLKYYIPVYNLAAPITFANPYLTLGLGGFRKTDKLQAQEVIETDSSAGLSLGAGLEFVVKPRATFFYVATKLHLVTFSDTSTTQYQTEGLENLAGQFITTTAGFLFTW